MSDRPKWHEKLSPQGREALDQGFNPRSMSDEDYAIIAKHYKNVGEGEDLAHDTGEEDDE